MQTEPEAKILLVDDHPENLLAMAHLLEQDDVRIITATSGNEALGLLLEHDFALIILDVQMPAMDGFETAALIRSRKQSHDIPIIFVTAINKEQMHVFKGYEAGAVDYLFKPVEPLILKSKVNVFLKLYRQKQTHEINTRYMNKTLAELKRANRQIVQQQKTAIEEERLKVLLEIAGATAHELNQPLMYLMGHLELLEMDKKKPEKLAVHLSRISEAGQRIADIVKKIQSIRYYETRSYLGDSEIIEFDQQLQILAVQPTGDDYEVLRRIISEQKKIKTKWAATAGQAFKMLLKENYSLILLDYQIKGSDALKFIAELKRRQIDVPVIVLLQQDDEMMVSKVLQSGATDYLPKNQIDQISLARVIANAMDKERLKDEIKIAQQRMSELSTQDELTGVYNYRYFFEALEREVSRATRYKNELAVGLVEIDAFNTLNENYGKLAEQHVAIEVARILSDAVRKSDLVARIGDAQFALLLPNMAPENVALTGNRFRKLIVDQKMEMKGVVFSISVSIGISTLGVIGKPATADELIQKADEALFKAVTMGEPKVRLWKKTRI